eukprot:TRINITY_DN1480_c0_g1_i12.p1 TRINITY_DN1480_c0_g1~~TRINITY_DN1480_c0_g1_i12.p1  ORF type:complete len:424 (-),score=97.02 TRINITY_DN1480_c0_g1_i12:30-1301(-)
MEKIITQLVTKLGNVNRIRKEEQENQRSKYERFNEFEQFTLKTQKEHLKSNSQLNDFIWDLVKFISLAKNQWLQKDFIEVSTNNNAINNNNNKSPTEQRLSQQQQHQLQLDHLFNSTHSWLSSKRNLFIIHQQLARSELTTDQSIKEIQKITQFEISNTDHPFIINLKKHFNAELSSFSNLLSSQHYIVNLQMKDAIVFLFKSKYILADWKTMIQQDQISANQKIPVRFSFNWLSSFYSAISSKFSFYFMRSLNMKDEECGGDPRQFLSSQSKSEPNFYSLIEIFVSRTDALSLSIIADSNKLPFHFESTSYKCYPPDYNYEDEKLSGIRSWPAIFNYPKEVPPQEHWPNIINIIFENQSSLKDPFQFFDRKVQCTYLVCQIEANLYLVSIYNKKKDQESISKDFASLCNAFKLVKLWEQIKT